jgi:hypothetical protein
VTLLREEKGCGLCPERTGCVLDFHHYKKGEPVSRMASKGYTALVREVNRCVVICANCHRKVHAGFLTITPEMLCHVEVADIKAQVKAMEL